MADKHFKPRIDCRRFRGDIPCSPGAVCEGCDRYEPMGAKILIIKLGAIGDVLRTTPILPDLREAHAPCHITWIVDSEGAPLLRNNTHIDRLVVHGLEAILRLSVERFDIVFSLDKHPAAAGLAAIAHADRKVGFILDATTGNISYTGDGAEYAWRLGLDDDLKFRRNRKTYQEMTFEMIGLPWRKQNYIFDIADEMREVGDSIIGETEFAGDGPLVGMVTGAGKIWPMKRWGTEDFAELADRLVDSRNARVILLGAQPDLVRNVEIKTMARLDHPIAPYKLDILEFAGLLSAMDVIVTGDTAAMHLGLALGVPTVALFGPTSALEVEMYDCGHAIVPKIDCAPCYKTVCDVSPTCMDRISVEEVFNSVSEILRKMYS